MGNLSDLNFDANQVEPEAQTGFEPVPEGDYIAMIAQSEKKTSKSGSDYLSLRIEIDGPTHAGRLLFLNLNLWHPNEKARQISQANLSAICRAVNVLTPSSSEDLHDRLMKIKVIVKKDKNSDELRNEVKSFAPYKSATSQVATPSTTEEGDDEPF